MKRGGNGFSLVAWRQIQADRPQSPVNAGKTGRRWSGDSAGDKVETEWRQQNLYLSPSCQAVFRPALLPRLSAALLSRADRCHPPRQAGSAGGCTAGLIPGPLAWNPAFCSAKDSPGRAVPRPAAARLPWLQGPRLVLDGEIRKPFTDWRGCLAMAQAKAGEW